MALSASALFLIIISALFALCYVGVALSVVLTWPFPYSTDLSMMMEDLVILTMLQMLPLL